MRKCDLIHLNSVRR